MKIEKLEIKFERDIHGNLHKFIMTSPTNEEIINKINEIIDHINKLEE